MKKFFNLLFLISITLLAIVALSVSTWAEDKIPKPGNIKSAEEFLKSYKEKEEKEKTEQKALESFQTEFKKSLSNGPVERFQAIRMSPEYVFIIDTKEGHIWVWGVSKETGAVLMYQGRVVPGSMKGRFLGPK